MSSLSPVLSTLEHVTQTKLDRLAKKQNAFETAKDELSAVLANAASDHEGVAALIDFVTEHGVQSNCCDVSYDNIKLFLDQARNDSSIPPATIREWKDVLEKEIMYQSLKYQYTSLCGKLVMEWLQNPNDVEQQHKGVPDDDDSDDSGSSFEAVEREELQLQRGEWESIAFNEVDTDPVAIHKYLDEFFLGPANAKTGKRTPLESFRDAIHDFDKKRNIRFDADTVQQSIRSLLRADLFAGDKRKALTDLKERKDLLMEIADVLNADIDSLDTWDWEPSPVAVRVRRHINGRYRFFLDEEIYQAIFLELIGLHWSVHIKTAAISHLGSGAWLQSSGPRPSTWDLQRREYFLGEGHGKESYKKSVRSVRLKTYKNDYFLTQLPSTIEEGHRDYSDDGDSENDSDSKSPLEIKQQVLGLITAEMLLNIELYGTFAVVQSDFKWFGPSIPHSTISAVLEYFHFPSKWQKFFTRFLTPELVFPQDGREAEGRTRKRGIPMSHQLSEALGEILLFTLDFAVNQRTSGWIYRLHDDMFFWSHDVDACVEAWKTITEFTKIMGLELNKEKTGAVYLTNGKDSQQASSLDDLPKGDIQWGFLKLDPETEGWVVRQDKLDEHIEELKRQLSTRSSILAFIQAYNAYLGRFFINNLGKPMVCLGTDHVNKVLQSIQVVQRGVFADFDSKNIVDHLKKQIAARFHTGDIPDAFLYFPFSLGGLAVQNPLIHCQSYHALSIADPGATIDNAVVEDNDAYEEAKEKYEKGKVRRSLSKPLLYPAGKEPHFMSLEEFTISRERYSTALHRVYEKLLKETPKKAATLTLKVARAQDGFSTRNLFNFPDADWVLELYGRNVIGMFGGLQMAESGFLPTALLNMLKDEKVRWAL